MSPTSSVYVLVFYQSMCIKVQMPYVPLIGSWHVLLPIPGPCTAKANLSFILSLPGMPRVSSAVCILGTSLLFFAEPHYLLHCHVGSNFIDLSGQCFLISSAIDSAYVGQCFDCPLCNDSFFGAIIDPFSLTIFS